MYLFEPFKSFQPSNLRLILPMADKPFQTLKICGSDPEPGFYFLTLLPQLEIKAKNMLADSSR